MTLGERISALRIENKMSQGDLAEKMNVSRQSISKWETDTSIPELDKLIQLSELFHVTLDELAKGDSGCKVEDSIASSQPVIKEQLNGKKIIGTILICFGALTFLLLSLLGGALGGLIFGSPFLLCGIICLIFEKNVGLWCSWAVFFTVNLYLRYATGITWGLVMLTLQYEASMNYMRLAFAWIELICFIVMIVVTVLRFQKKPLVLSTRNKVLYIVGCLLLAVLFIPFSFWPMSAISYAYYLLLDWVRVALIVALLTTTLRFVRAKIKEK